MEKQFNGVMSQEKIRQSLDQIRSFIDNELAEKKETIKDLKQAIEELKQTIHQKDQIISGLETNVKECKEAAEGNRHLINKLLGEISRLQNDVDWYKRTYEERSLWGTIREKIFRKHH